MDTAQWPQGIGFVKAMELESSRSLLERRARPQKDQALNCPRCNSTNTKFCYYNNYSLSQPRYFCKTCRRYWTEGGSLRNVPVGGGSRKNKRSSSSSYSSSSSSALSRKLVDHLTPPSFSHSAAASQNPKIDQGQDLNLAYPPTDQDYGNISKFIEAPFGTENNTTHNQNNSLNTSHHHRHLTAMDLLKTGISSKGFASFMPSDNNIPASAAAADSHAIYPIGFPLQEFKPSLSFSLDHGFESSTGSRILFPAGDIKQVQSNSGFEPNRGQGNQSTGYCWTGMLGGGSWSLNAQ